MNYLSANVVLEVDKDKIRVQLDSVKQHFSKTATSIQSRAKRMSLTVGAAFSKMSSFAKSTFSKMKRYAKWAVVALAGVGIASVKMAMDAEESENLFEVSMGNMADATRKWSEELSKALYLNAFEVRKNVSVFNVMFDSMGFGANVAADMSKNLTQLAYDMASFYNLKPEQVFIKLQAGITGEAEALKRLGILVNENSIKQYALNNAIGDGTGKLNELEKVQARYGSILEQTKKAQGDLERTLNSSTNVFRGMWSIVKQVAITFGETLRPKITAVARDMRDWISENTSQIKKWGEDFWNAASKVIDVFKSVSATLVKHKKIVLGVVAAYVGFGALSVVTTMVIAARNAIIGLTAAYTALNATTAVSWLKFAGLGASLKHVWYGLQEGQIALFTTARAAGGLAGRISLATGKLFGFNVALAATVAIISKVFLAVGIVAILGKIVSKAREWHSVSKKVEESIAKQTQLQEKFNEKLKDASNIMKQLDKAWPTEPLETAGNYLAEKLQERRDAYDKLYSDLDVMSEDHYAHELRKINEQADIFRKSLNDMGLATKDRVLIEQWAANEIVKLNEKKNKAIEVDTTVVDAYRSMHGQMGKITAKTYEAELGLIDTLKNTYVGWKMDQATIDQWYAEQKRKLDIELYESSNNIWKGAKAAGMKMKDEMKTWGEIASDTAFTMRDAFASGMSSMILEAKSGSEAINEFLRGIGKELVNLLVKQAATGLFANVLGGSLAATAPIESAAPAPFVPSFEAGAMGYGGGIVGRMPKSRNISPLDFVGAPSFKNGGIVSRRTGEVPIIAHEGETIIPAGQQIPPLVVNNIMNNKTGIPLVTKKVSVTETEIVTDILMKDMKAGGPISQGIQRIK